MSDKPAPLQPYLQIAKAIYYEATYQRCRAGWPITRRWVAENPAILVNGPRDEAAAQAARQQAA